MTQPYLVQVKGRDVWHLRDGKKRLSTGETKLPDATAFLLEYVERKKKTGGKKSKKKETVETLAAVLDAWAAWKKLENPRNFEKKWRFLVAKLKARDGHTPLVSLDAAWRDEYVRERLLVDGVKPPTVRQELSLVMSSWQHAFLRDVVHVEPRKFELPKASAPRDFFLTRDDVRALLDACDRRHLRLFVRLAVATGSRPGAILGLTWSRVDLEKGLVDLRDSTEDGERKRAALVPISRDVVEELEAAKEVALSRFVVEYKAGRTKSIARSFRVAVAKSGIDPRATPHILRHSAATWMAQDGVTFFEIAGFLGHSSTSMVEKVYGHHHPDFMKNAQKAVSLYD